MSERRGLNGSSYQFDDYGTVEKHNIIDEDQLVSFNCNIGGQSG